MEWINVEEKLPPDDQHVLVLVEGYFVHKGKPDLGRKKSTHIFEGSFSRRHGWCVPFSPADYYPIISWMPAPKPPISEEPSTFSPPSVSTQGSKSRACAPQDS